MHGRHYAAKECDQGGGELHFSGRQCCRKEISLLGRKEESRGLSVTFFIIAPAHPHATRVAVYPTLFIFDVPPYRYPLPSPLKRSPHSAISSYSVLLILIQNILSMLSLVIAAQNPRGVPFFLSPSFLFSTCVHFFSVPICHLRSSSAFRPCNLQSLATRLYKPLFRPSVRRSVTKLFKGRFTLLKDHLNVLESF